MYKKAEDNISEFKRRVGVDGSEFCHRLFEWATLRLMAHKYSYYVLHDSYLKDTAYDGEERSWYAMGRALDILKEDETSPCVDFDFKHRLANDAKILAEFYTSRKDPQVADEVCRRYDPCY